MEILTQEEAHAWEFLPPDFDPKDLANPYLAKCDKLFRLPSMSGPKSAFSREIAAICNLPALLWIEHDSVSSSSEHPPLFGLARKAFGDERTLDEAPVQLFEEEDRDALSAFLAMVLYFSWTAELFEANNTRRWAFNNDEFLFITSDDKEKCIEALELVRDFELEEWVRRKWYT